jgi:hypothetical protein
MAVTTFTTRAERYILRRFHPRAVLLDSVAAIWAVYFVWNHNWVAALAVVVASRLIGTALAWRMDYSTIKETVWGKLALLHIHPANSVIQTLAALALFYGIWIHETITILAGLSVIILGHYFGWAKVMRGL